MDTIRKLYFHLDISRLAHAFLNIVVVIGRTLEAVKELEMKTGLDLTSTIENSKL